MKDRIKIASDALFLAVTIIGGLFISTFITLLLVPVVYLLMHKAE